MYIKGLEADSIAMGRTELKKFLSNSGVTGVTTESAVILLLNSDVTGVAGGLSADLLKVV